MVSVDAVEGLGRSEVEYSAACGVFERDLCDGLGFSSSASGGRRFVCCGKADGLKKSVIMRLDMAPHLALTVGRRKALRYAMVHLT